MFDPSALSFQNSHGFLTSRCRGCSETRAFWSEWLPCKGARMAWRRGVHIHISQAHKVINTARHTHTYIYNIILNIDICKGIRILYDHTCIHYIMLRYVAVQYIAMHSITLIRLHYITLHYNTIHYIRRLHNMT